MKHTILAKEISRKFAPISIFRWSEKKSLNVVPMTEAEAECLMDLLLKPWIADNRKVWLEKGEAL